MYNILSNTNSLFRWRVSKTEPLDKQVFLTLFFCPVFKFLISLIPRFLSSINVLYRVSPSSFFALTSTNVECHFCFVLRMTGVRFNSKQTLIVLTYFKYLILERLILVIEWFSANPRRKFFVIWRFDWSTSIRANQNG